ncbi:hypothetical protein AYO38_00420 [bacterium SCGC AG-212-C10]|nr:hypothetical protein AYO38_00420 [bacterium SCGC AG-212-C10]
MTGQIERQRPIQTATILMNPMARGIRRFDSAGAEAYLKRRGIEPRVKLSESPLHASRIAARAAEREEDLLFVIGGDGTLRDAARGMAGARTALAPIQAGTANVLAREFGIPHGIPSAFKAHLSGQTVAMDVGLANDEMFLMMAGIGWDADVVGGVGGRMKQRTGQLAYVLATARRLPRFHTVEAEWSSGLMHWQGPLAQMVVSNTRLYGGLVRPIPNARANDGALDFLALCPRVRGDGLRLSAKLMLRRTVRDTRVLTGRVPELAISTPGIPYQLDGDYEGVTPLRLRVQPLALQLRIPAGPLPPALATAE